MSFEYDTLEQDDKGYLWHPFTQQQDWEAEPQIVITRAEGCYLIDSVGRRYLDGVSSLWANLHGHQHPLIDAAIRQQLTNVAHTTMLGLTHPGAIQLGKRLIEIAPGNLRRVFYSDTGAAAVEIAIKMAYQYWQQIHPARPQKSLFLSINNAYHGDTVGAMSVGGIETYRHTYHSLFFSTVTVDMTVPCTCGNQPSCTSCELPCLDEVERAMLSHADELVAVILEPLFQGAGGIHVYPRGYTRAIQEIARRSDVLFIVDEVASGFGRTGSMFACEQENIEPDILCLGKGLSGGYLPLAATLATEEIYQAFLGEGRTFYHGHTYTGNPLACAAALANLDIFEQEKTLERLQPLIQQLQRGLERLRSLPLVTDIRQCGFVAGIELALPLEKQKVFPHARRLGTLAIKEARQRGVMLRPLGNTLVLMPPLAISTQELTFLLDVVQASIRSLSEELEHE